MKSDQHEIAQAQARKHVPAWLLSPEGLPAGFETCWSFLFRTEPWVLLDISPGIEGLELEDAKARALARCYMEPVIEVDTGEGMIGAYTRAVLHGVFPANP